MTRPRAAERLGEAAFSQLVTVGADSLTMEGIANRAGVSIGAAYRWQPSLHDAVLQAIGTRLPSMAEQITEAPSLHPWLQPQALGSRLLTESLLAVRRFPTLTPLVQQAVELVQGGLQPLGAAVLVGSQAMMLAGCALTAQDRRVLADLYQRIRTTSPDGPLPWSTPDRGDFIAEVPSTHTADLDQIAQGLINATARALASSTETSVRTIAESAGVTTGAIYRRYQSKDQLVAETIRSHLTADRTTWAVAFVARLAGTQAGDPAQILAEQLALASNRDAEQTRLSIEFIVASRMSPDARQVLVQRIEQAQHSRQTLFEAMLEAGIFTRPDTPRALSWALQVTPTGTRLLSLVSPQPSATTWQPAMASMLRAL